MNWFKHFLILTLVLAISACGDDEKTCTQADWVGIYEGTLACETTNPRPTRIKISPYGTESVVIEYEFVGAQWVVVDTVDIDDCKIKRRETSFDSVERLSITWADDKIDVALLANISGLSELERCEITATKQE